MKVARIGLHALFLGMVNLFSILAGFGLYALFKPVNQILVQLPAALFLTLAIYLLFSALLPRLNWPEIMLRGRAEFVWVFASALLVMPLIFYPLHYLTQGYLAHFSNVLSTWAFQIPANALALFLAWRAARAEMAAGKEGPG